MFQMDLLDIFQLTLDLNAAIAANPFPQRSERFPCGKQSMDPTKNGWSRSRF